MKTKPAYHDFLRITAASLPLHLADPASNVTEIVNVIATHAASDIVLLPELSITGYTCGDLFGQDTLLQSAIESLARVADATHGGTQIVVVGLPLSVLGRLYNAAAVLFDGRVVALIPKQYLPNYREFYEARWFTPADGNEPSEVNLPGLGSIPFGIDLLIDAGRDITIGIELCEDLWMPIPPSSLQAVAGANVLLNLSASNELIGKAQWRRTLVQSQSGRCLAAYAYASAGPTESSTDLVFGGHCLIAENGHLLSESDRVGQNQRGWVVHTHATADIDMQRLAHDRRITNSWASACLRHGKPFRRIAAHLNRLNSLGSARPISGQPFVPGSEAELHDRCGEIFGIQCAALARRLQQLPADLPLAIGVSGGLDSTLALLVAVRTLQEQQQPVTRIQALTMPGFGTTEQTLDSARRLMDLLGVTAHQIDIRQLCLDAFCALGHHPFGVDPGDMDVAQFTTAIRRAASQHPHDLVFENVQARMRTMLLMNRGFVLGTGDMSEQALGWSTYNGDHMSMYNVNCSIPKTLVRFLVQYAADHLVSSDVRDCLQQVLETPISPELLPPGPEGQITQATEAVIGSYELHDFFLYHLVRFGAGPARILHLASLAEFSRSYTADEIRQTLRTFLTRFFHNQFKRSCVPDGPKVGSVSLSPRGDWRMPSDAEVAAWLHELS
ncbi:MAG: NAD(+) synthase [Planctomycetota bacterium]|nr:MAG: NAD(+) synthase [Planctomycetota bacterium]